MTEFRGSRRLMSRIREQTRITDINRNAWRRQLPKDEIELRQRLESEANMRWASGNGPTLRKAQAPKT